MNKKFSALIIFANLLILTLSPLWGAHIHHSHSLKSNSHFSIIIHNELIKCKHSPITCIDQCEKELLLDHLFKNGVIFTKSDTNYLKIKKSPVISNIISNKYIFSDESIYPLLVESNILSDLFHISAQSSRAPPLYSKN